MFVARDPGFMALSLSSSEKDFAAAMKEMLEEIGKSSVHSPASAARVAKGRTNMASEQYYYLETVDGSTASTDIIRILFRRSASTSSAS